MKNNTLRWKRPPAPGLSKTVPFYRPVWAEINHTHLKHNLRELQKAVSPGTAFLCVVKANAYGHGIVPVSRSLAECGPALFGVTSLEEALQLRAGGVKIPSLILGNIFPFSNLEIAIRNDVRVTVASVESAEMCARYAQKMGRPVRVHAKIDTGMSRIGVQPAGGLAFIKKIRDQKHLRLEGVYTHFSDSAEDPAFTREQLQRFNRLASEIRKAGIAVPYVHCANSAAILKYPQSHFTLVRTGLALYGVSNVKTAPPARLRPVLSWKSRIVFLKQVPEGTPVSYAGTFVTKRKSKIATAAFGYADGFRRSLSNNSRVLVNGRLVPTVGRITMDMTMLDVTDLERVRVGDEVVLIGEQGPETLPVEALARWAQTSPYEIFCNIAERVPRVAVV